MKGLESHNIFIKFFRIITVPVMNKIPKSVLQNIMHKTSHDAGTVVKNGGSTIALEAMYSRYHRGIFSRGVFQGLADMFWHHLISQPKALRNRLKIVEEVIESRLISLIKNGKKDIRILNIGGGSSRALIHTISKLKKEGFEFYPKIVNVDKDIRAIEKGKEISKHHGLQDIFTWVNDDARNLDSLVEPESFDIVEMVGLLDYFDDERAKKILDPIYNSLYTDGLFVVANVHFNDEMKFVENTGWPKMQYRNASDIKNVIEKSGFKKEPHLIFEPLGVHIVAVVEK